MSNIDKQALIAKIKKQTESFDTVVLKEDEANALLDELEAKDRRIEEEIGRANREHHRGFMMACGHLKEHSNVHYADAAEMEIAALRKRINELEAREVKLPELCVGVVQDGHAVMVPYAAGHWFNKTAILEMLTDAGINIAAAGKGE